jgi:hypothetical protein
MSYPHIHVNSKRKKGPKKERVVIIVIVNQVKTAICPVLRTGSTKGDLCPVECRYLLDIFYFVEFDITSFESAVVHEFARCPLL